MKPSGETVLPSVSGSRKSGAFVPSGRIVEGALVLRRALAAVGMKTPGSALTAVFWLIVNPPWKIVAAHYAPAQWLFLFVFSMLSVLGAFSLYFLGLQHLEPTRAIIASCLEPVFSILLAALLLGEVLRPIQILGIVLVLAAIVIVQRPGSAIIADTVIV